MTRSLHLLRRCIDSLPGRLMGVLTLGMFLVPSVQSQTITQNVPLTAGWNAVWLEVEPLYATGTQAGQTMSASDLFTDPNILIVASPTPLSGIAEFFAGDPGTITTFNQDEWQQWKQTDPTGSNNLSLVFGNRPYLIQVAPGAADFSLPVTGKVRFFRPKWIPDRYNLLGFGLDGAHTFSNFFTASGTRHPVNKIFTLNPDGSWVTVAGSATMVSDRAYWIFSSGPSDYMGPVAVDFDHAVAGRLDFGGPGDEVPIGTGVDLLSLDLKELIFTNLEPAPVAPAGPLPPAVPELDLIASSDTGLELHVVRPVSVGLGYVRGNQVDSASGVATGSTSGLGESIASSTTAALTLGATHGWTTGTVSRTNLYRLRCGEKGASVWLPVTALSSEVTVTPDMATLSEPETVQGLWVGDVVIQSSTSIVQDGAPTVPTAAAAPIRILLHSDGAGVVRLLSQVTIMQTKTADPEIPSEPVLVLTAAKIPFFEGIKERNGKRVGLRLEAVAFDMPRSSNAWSGTALTSFTTRPPTLLESYDLHKVMLGALGAGKSVTGSLTIDPFHRSNPFRHAYHHDLPGGPAITRTIQIVFDAEQSQGDRLKGTFTETITGLIQSALELQGTLDLRRVSPVATLDPNP